jgi:hypothetical protein
MSPAGFVNRCFEAMVSKIGQRGDSKMYELLQFYDTQKIADLENKNNINHNVNYLSDRKIAEKFSFYDT